MRIRLAVLIGRCCAFALSLFGRAGTTLPGRVVLAVDPDALQKIGSRLGAGTALISATNGKTTTANLVERAVRSAGTDVVHNSEGANMSGGIVSSMIGGAQGASTLGLFEVDEFWLPDVGDQLEPAAVLLSNLFRDQLDRYGELDTILDRWVESTERLAVSGTKVVLCCDDPGMAWIGQGLPAESVIWFGLEDPSHSIGDLPPSADAGSCRRCGVPLTYSTVLLGHLGHWKCGGCGLTRPEPDYACSRLTLDGARGLAMEINDPVGTHEVELKLPGVYNAYNALGAWTLCSVLGLSPALISESFALSGASFGRSERFKFGGHEVSMLLIKNPTGANEVFRTLESEGEDLSVLFVLNDQIADGRDVSWIWDADLETLAPRIGRVICSGSRAAEAALRFRYAGVPVGRIDTINDSFEGLEQLAEQAPGDLWILPTYTAMLNLRKELADRGAVERVV